MYHNIKINNISYRMQNNIVTIRDLKVLPHEIEHLILDYVKQLLRFGDINAKNKQNMHKIIRKIDYKTICWLVYKNHSPMRILFQHDLMNSFGYPHYGKIYKLNDNYVFWTRNDIYMGLEEIILLNHDWNSSDSDN